MPSKAAGVSAERGASVQYRLFGYQHDRSVDRSPRAWRRPPTFSRLWNKTQGRPRHARAAHNPSHTQTHTTSPPPATR